MLGEGGEEIRRSNGNQKEVGPSVFIHLSARSRRGSPPEFASCSRAGSVRRPSRHPAGRREEWPDVWCQVVGDDPAERSLVLRSHSSPLTGQFLNRRTPVSWWSWGEEGEAFCWAAEAACAAGWGGKKNPKRNAISLLFNRHLINNHC